MSFPEIIRGWLIAVAIGLIGACVITIGELKSEKAIAVAVAAGCVSFIAMALLSRK